VTPTALPPVWDDAARLDASDLAGERVLAEAPRPFLAAGFAAALPPLRLAAARLPDDPFPDEGAPA
jgi:hypothetical protein